MSSNSNVLSSLTFKEILDPTPLARKVELITYDGIQTYKREDGFDLESCRFPDMQDIRIGLAFIDAGHYYPQDSEIGLRAIKKPRTNPFLKKRVREFIGNNIALRENHESCVWHAQIVIDSHKNCAQVSLSQRAALTKSNIFWRDVDPMRALNGEQRATICQMTSLCHLIGTSQGDPVRKSQKSKRRKMKYHLHQITELFSYLAKRSCLEYLAQQRVPVLYQNQETKALTCSNEKMNSDWDLGITKGIQESWHLLNQWQLNPNTRMNASALEQFAHEYNQSSRIACKYRKTA